jgi:hypothetical protein
MAQAERRNARGREWEALAPHRVMVQAEGRNARGREHRKVHGKRARAQEGASTGGAS